MLLIKTSLRTLGDLQHGSTKWLLLAWVRRCCCWLSQHVHPALRHGCHSNDSHTCRGLGQRHLHSSCALAWRSIIDRRRMACQLVDEIVAPLLLYDVFVMRTLYSISGTGPGASSRVVHTDPCTPMHPYPLWCLSVLINPFTFQDRC